jgi:hypothetical protein
VLLYTSRTKGLTMTLFFLQVVEFMFAIKYNISIVISICIPATNARLNRVRLVINVSCRSSEY